MYLPEFAGLIEAVMAPAAFFFVALAAGGSGITGGLPIIDLYLPDNLGLEAEWPGFFRFHNIRDVHR